jgi:hypothetical protein
MSARCIERSAEKQSVIVRPRSYPPLRLIMFSICSIIVGGVKMWGGLQQKGEFGTSIGMMTGRADRHLHAMGQVSGAVCRCMYAGACMPVTWKRAPGGGFRTLEPGWNDEREQGLQFRTLS